MTHKPIDLREFARNWKGGCLIRIPNHCVWTPTCLCHDRTGMNGVAAGMGYKPVELDFCGMIGCDACHAIIDQRVRVAFFSKQDLRVFRYHGLLRTWAVYAQTMRLVLVRDPNDL